MKRLLILAAIGCFLTSPAFAGKDRCNILGTKLIPIPQVIKIAMLKFNTLESIYKVSLDDGEYRVVARDTKGVYKLYIDPITGKILNQNRYLITIFRFPKVPATVMPISKLLFKLNNPGYAETAPYKNITEIELEHKKLADSWIYEIKACDKDGYKVELKINALTGLLYKADY